MSRSGYTEDCEDDLARGRWRAQVASAIRGSRGQAFLRELVAALDSMPVPRLIAHDLRTKTGEVCAIGRVGALRGVQLAEIDPEDYGEVSDRFGVARQLVQEIAFENDECAPSDPAKRWKWMRAWAAGQIKPGP